MDYLNSSDFASRMEEVMKKHHVPGLAIAIVEGERTFSAGYGLASLDPPRPCTADTLFDIASSSKSLTAASVALLVRDNDKYPDVQYEAIMSKLLPEDFVLSDPRYTEEVTLEDTLCHRTGLPRHDDSYLGLGAAKPDDARSVTRNLRNLALVAPLRSKYMYTNIMYTVATYLVEKKSGLPFPDFLQEHFFGPLGMSSTHLQPERSRSFGLGDRIATGYSWDKKEERYVGLGVVESPEAQGAGLIITSVNDFIKWVKALMNREHPIDDEIYAGLTKLRNFAFFEDDNPEPFTSPAFYTAGMEVFYYRGHMVVGHDGGIDGFSSKFFFVPDFKFGASIFANSSDREDIIGVLSRELIDEVLGVPASERPDWRKLQDEQILRWEKSSKRSEMERLLREEAEPQKVPLSAYTGEYWNPGYRGMTVEVKDGKLFIDASDRSMGFHLRFDHLRSQTEYIVHYINFPSGENSLMEGEFMFQNDKVVKMGLELEPDGDELIWFHKVEEDRATH
ncbi:beta-lactamase family protein [Xylaria cf. heliscus]|nr:beta-lactamase family protein [Xylaria cf. heliscus]